MAWLRTFIKETLNPKALVQNFVQSIVVGSGLVITTAVVGAVLKLPGVYLAGIAVGAALMLFAGGVRFAQGPSAVRKPQEKPSALPPAYTAKHHSAGSDRIELELYNLRQLPAQLLCWVTGPDDRMSLAQAVLPDGWMHREGPAVDRVGLSFPIEFDHGEPRGPFALQEGSYSVEWNAIFPNRTPPTINVTDQFDYPTDFKA